MAFCLNTPGEMGRKKIKEHGLRGCFNVYYCVIKTRSEVYLKDGLKDVIRLDIRHTYI